jgi:riboflavin-specific deaminase-like protein
LNFKVKQAARLNSKLKTKNSKLPFVLVNMAMTADGKIATANRAVSTFGSQRDHEHLLELRATADAVMAGAATVNAAPINLGPGALKFRRRRLKTGLAEYNLRVIVSGSGSLDPDAEIFREKISPVIVLTTRRASGKKLNRLRAVADEVTICGKTEINFRAALRWLRTHWNVRRLLCEGGGELNDALFRAGLVDEVHLTICPIIFGGRNAPTIAEGIGFQRLAKAQGFQIQRIKRVENELFTMFTLQKLRLAK